MVQAEVLNIWGGKSDQKLWNKHTESLNDKGSFLEQ